MGKASETNGLFRFGTEALKALKPFGAEGLIFAVGIVVSCGALILRADPVAVVAVDALAIGAYIFMRERDAGRKERAAEREFETIRITAVAEAQRRLTERLSANMPARLPAPAPSQGEQNDQSV